MGDPRRFDVFARFIAARVPVEIRAELRVADVAAGKGALSFALREHGFRRVVPFEPAPRRGGQVRRLGMQVRDFSPDLADRFDLLVGMHPDGATDCILEGAARFGVAAIVSPCCVRPNAWAYWGSKVSHVEWHAHLIGTAKHRGLDLDVGRLPISGANAVFVGNMTRVTTASAIATSSRGTCSAHLQSEGK